MGVGAAVAGVPARDLTAEEAASYGRAALVASGLYAEPAEPSAPAAEPEKPTRKGKAKGG